MWPPATSLRPASACRCCATKRLTPCPRTFCRSLRRASSYVDSRDRRTSDNRAGRASSARAPSARFGDDQRFAGASSPRSGPARSLSTCSTFPTLESTNLRAQKKSAALSSGASRLPEKSMQCSVNSEAGRPAVRLCDRFSRSRVPCHSSHRLPLATVRPRSWRTRRRSAARR